MFQRSLPWRSDVLPRRPLLSLTAALASAALLIPASAQATPCANTELTPTTTNAPAIRAAVLCLHNQIRSQNNLPLLTTNSKLRRAARNHSTAMVSQSFFDHTGPSGTTLIDRLRNARYMRPGQAWVAGENIAWATGNLATPASIMTAWMNSPGHRANILRRPYRELGIGITTGTPTDTTQGATYTTDFGAHR